MDSEDERTGIGPRRDRVVLEPVMQQLRTAGFYAYFTIGQANRWAVACDTESGRIDVQVGPDGLRLDVWDTSPGLFGEEEQAQARAAQERLARVSLPAIARGMLGPDEQIWWDENDHGVGARIRLELPFAAQEQIAQIAQRQLARLNDLIVEIENRLLD